MAFWLFMSVMDLLIPLTMLGFGRRFLKKPPGRINSVFGYRTARSMKNSDTWVFAHRHAGLFWYRWGWPTLAVSLVCMLTLLGKPIDTVSLWGGILTLLQCVPLAAVVPSTEKALKQNFDQSGRRITPE